MIWCFYSFVVVGSLAWPSHQSDAAVALFFLTPYGLTATELYFSLFVVVPLVAAAAMVWFCKPA